MNGSPERINEGLFRDLKFKENVNTIYDSYQRSLKKLKALNSYVYKERPL